MPRLLLTAIRRRGWAVSPVARSVGNDLPWGSTTTSRGPSCPSIVRCFSATEPTGTTAITWLSRYVKPARTNPTNQTGHQKKIDEWPIKTTSSGGAPAVGFVVAVAIVRGTPERRAVSPLLGRAGFGFPPRGHTSSLSRPPSDVLP